MAADLVLVQFAGVPGRWLDWSLNLVLRMAFMRYWNEVGDEAFREGAELLEAHRQWTARTMLDLDPRIYRDDPDWQPIAARGERLYARRSPHLLSQREIRALTTLLATAAAELVTGAPRAFMGRLWPTRGTLAVLEVVLRRAEGEQVVQPFLRNWLSHIPRTLPVQQPARDVAEAVQMITFNQLMSFPGFDDLDAEAMFGSDAIRLEVEVDEQGLVTHLHIADRWVQHVSDTLRTLLLRMETPPARITPAAIQAGWTAYLQHVAFNRTHNQMEHYPEASEMLVQDRLDVTWHPPYSGTHWRLEFRYPEDE